MNKGYMVDVIMIRTAVKSIGDSSVQSRNFEQSVFFIFPSWFSKPFFVQTGASVTYDISLPYRYKIHAICARRYHDYIYI